MTRPAVAAFGLALASAAAVHGQVTIFALNNWRGAGETSDRLVSFQSNNPAGWTSIGLTGAAGVQFSGLDFAGVGGGLFAWGSSPLTGDVGLFSINPDTGVATLVQQGAPMTGIRDLSWNPVTNQMVAIQTNPARLYTINLTNGAATLIGEITGMASSSPLVEGLAYDSAGNFYIHDVSSDDMYFGNGLSATLLHPNLPNTGFGFYGQGMVVDWSGNDQGYHSTAGLTPMFGALYTFTTSSYTLAGHFGPPGTFPTMVGGDLAIRPVPAPGGLALLGVGAVVGRRRRG